MRCVAISNHTTCTRRQCARTNQNNTPARSSAGANRASSSIGGTGRRRQCPGRGINSRWPDGHCIRYGIVVGAARPPATAHH